MVKINNTNEWNNKFKSCPAIPKVGKSCFETIQEIIQLIESKRPLKEKLIINNVELNCPLSHYAERMYTLGILNKTDEVYQYSVNLEAKDLLDNHKDSDLFIFIHNNICFFGELLKYINDNPNSNYSNFLEYARKFSLNWRTKSEISNRILIFLELGVIYESQPYKYSITEKGKSVLKRLLSSNKNQTELTFDECIKKVNEIPLKISDWILEFNVENSNEIERKKSLGYFSKYNGLLSSFLIILEYCKFLKSKEEILDFITDTFSINKRSALSFLHTLNRIELIDRKTRNDYQTSDLGMKMLEEGSAVDLIYCFHIHTEFILEILYLLKDNKLNRNEIFEKRYLFNYSGNKPSVNSRLQLLTEANLIIQIGLDDFVISKSGLDLLNLLNINPVIEENQEETNESLESLKDEVFYQELRDSSVNKNNNPTLFESNLSKAFSTLGLETEHIGGSGAPDVIIKFKDALSKDITVMIEAKTATSGYVTEKNIRFDILKRMIDKNNIDFTFVVGPDFEGSRLIQMASENNIGLLTVENLIKILEWHKEIPLSKNNYIEFFKTTGLVDLDQIENSRQEINRFGELIKSVVKVFNTFEDEGILDSKSIYITLKYKAQTNNEKTNYTQQEIEDVLTFLSNPYLNYLESTKQGYYQKNSVYDAARRFEFFMKTIDSLK